MKDEDNYIVDFNSASFDLLLLIDYIYIDNYDIKISEQLLVQKNYNIP